MAATRDQQISAIAPGSTEFGERGALVQGLPGQSGGGPGINGGGGGPPSPAPSGPSTNGGAMEALMRGKGASPLPVTDGLSVGPGRGPEQIDPAAMDAAAKLRLMATQAKTPVLREIARRELLRMAKQGVI